MNAHDHVDPYVSAAIITSHTRDGVALAKAYRLPEAVQQIIAQHHGNTPVMFFYHKALQQANGNPVDINVFRYDGHPPTTKEAAIVMLCDTIEAAVRTMKNPTPEGIDEFIVKLVRGKLEDGQLSDSPLTLRDIEKICAAASQVLVGVFHERIEYPDMDELKVQRQAEKTTAEVMQEKEPALQNGTWEERHDELLGFCHKVVKEIPTNAALQRYNEGKPVNEKMKPTGLSIGFEYVNVERVNYPQFKNLRKLRRQTEQDMSNACHTLTKRELMERSMPQNYSFNDLHQKIQQLKNPQKGTEFFHKYDSLGNNVSKLILNLAITEHLRWSASHEMLGYKKGNKTDEQRQLHNCLVGWEELDRVSCQSCKDATERLENGETWDYDFSKHIKENYPHYKNKVKAYVLFLPDYKRFDFGVVETTIALLKGKENRRDQ